MRSDRLLSYACKGWNRQAIDNFPAGPCKGRYQQQRSSEILAARKAWRMAIQAASRLPGRN